MMKIALSVENLSKIYLDSEKKTPKINALRNITLDVKQGEILVYWVRTVLAKLHF